MKKEEALFSQTSILLQEKLVQRQTAILDSRAVKDQA